MFCYTQHFIWSYFLQSHNYVKFVVFVKLLYLLPLLTLLHLLPLLRLLHLLHLLHFSGIGISSTIVVFFLNCYYNVILCWSFYYMFSSFALELPWTSCGKWWNSENCYDFDQAQSPFVTNVTNTAGFSKLLCSNSTRTYFALFNESGVVRNESYPNQTCVPNHLRLDSVQEFWE